jgi:quinol monooxygenase YgiN
MSPVTQPRLDLIGGGGGKPTGTAGSFAWLVTGTDVTDWTRSSSNHLLQMPTRNTLGSPCPAEPRAQKSPARDSLPRIGLMLIIAGSLILDPAHRAAFLAANADVVSQARHATGCLDFVQAADPLDPGRINVFERWETEDDLLAFRGAGQPASDSPPIQSADVKRYVISAVEEP